MAALAPGASVTVRVPASSANLGPGFDSIGLALGIYDEVTATVTDGGLLIDVEGEGSDSVRRDEGHLVVQSMHTLWKRLGVSPPAGLTLHARNEIPHARGVGSSAAAIVAGVGAALALTGASLSDPAALALVNDVAGDLEGHPDNASASVYGGATVSWRASGREGWETASIPLHANVFPVVFIPEATLSTQKARAALAPTVPLADAASGAGRTALLTLALSQRPDLLLPATRDWLHQEARRPAYPESMALVDRLRDAGHAAVISGAGPTVLVLATDAATTFSPPDGWAQVRPGVAAIGVHQI